VSKEDAAAAKIQARSRGQAHRKGKSSPGMHSHAQGSQRLHQVKTVYGINEPKKLSPLEQRLAALEKENSLLRLRLDPLDPAAATAAQQAADQSAKGFVSSQNKGGGGGPVKDEAVDAWKLDSWIRSLGLDGVVASALLKHLKKTSGKCVEKNYMANMRTFGSQQTIMLLLKDALVLEELAVVLWQGTEKLSAELTRRQGL